MKDKLHKKMNINRRITTTLEIKKNLKFSRQPLFSSGEKHDCKNTIQGTHFRVVNYAKEFQPYKSMKIKNANED